jgi:hypothetical protein
VEPALFHHALQFPIRCGDEADIVAERFVAANVVDVYVTKNWYCNFEGCAGGLYRERNYWLTELQGARSRTIDEEVPYGHI